MNARTPALVGFAPLALLLQAIAQEPSGYKLVTELVERRPSPELSPPIALAYESLKLSGEAPKGAPELPRGLKGGQWASVQVGGKPVHLLLAGSSPDAPAPDFLWIDLDADGRFREGERLALQPSARELNDGSKSWTARLEGLEVRSGGNVFSVGLAYSQTPTRGLAAQLLFEEWHEAQVTLGEKQYVIALLDADHDGSFGAEKDRWYLFPAAERPAQAAGSYALHAFTEGRFQDGLRITLKPQGPTRVEVVAKPSAGPDPRDLESHRTRVEHAWFERFDAEREQFVKDMQVDTARPRAAKPIPWRYLSFDEAVAIARAEDKPLFVDVMAFWCVWCYRLDYYTYVDAEVAKLLSEEFVPVKIVQEQDLAGDYGRVRDMLQARGIPAMGIFAPTGELLHKIGGWKKAEDFLTDLQQGLALFRGEKN